MKCAFVAKHRAIWPVRWLRKALGVSCGGFHAWLTRRPSARPRSDEVLGAQLKASCIGRDQTYGARWVWYDVLAEGGGCGAHPVERLKCDLALPRGRSMLLGKAQGVRHVLDRDFKGTAPNPKWIADFTHIWMSEG